MTSDVVDYFKLRILVDLGILEAIVAKQPDRHPGITKLARRTKDQVWRRFYLETADPRRIRKRIKMIRDLATCDEVIEADSELRRLMSDLDAVRQEVELPYRAKVVKRMMVGQKAGRDGGRPKGVAKVAERNRDMAKEFLRRQGKGELSDTGLMVDIGANQVKPLSRSQSITAINDGLARLKKPSG